jgi:hypothetical protein
MRERRVDRNGVRRGGTGGQVAERPGGGNPRLADLDLAKEVRLVGESSRCRHRGKQDGQDA